MVTGCVRLEGTPSAIGHQHGQMLACAIHELERALFVFLARGYGGGLRGRLLARGIYLAMRFVAGAMLLRYWPNRYREELRGMVVGMRAAGSRRCDVTRLALINSFDDIVGAWASRSLACSAFAVQGDHGKMLVGRNLDYHVMPDR